MGWRSSGGGMKGLLSGCLAVCVVFLLLCPFLQIGITLWEDVRKRK